MENKISRAPTLRGFDKFAYLALGLLLIINIYIHFKWLSIYRFDQILDIDESWYVGKAILYGQTLYQQGFAKWISLIYTPLGIDAPALEIFSSFLMFGTKSPENIALFSNIIVCTALLIVVFQIVALQSDRVTAFIATLAVASLPAISDYTRSYQFAQITTLFYVFTIFCYLKSNHFQSTFWALATGISLGMMTLSRTMAIAFLPVFAIIFLIDISIAKNFSKRKAFTNIFLSIIIFIITCGFWYYINFENIYNYLTDYGYGIHETEYAKTKDDPIHRIINRVSNLVNQISPYVFTLISLPILLNIYKIFFHRIKKDSNFLVLLLICVFSTGILASSRNEGSGFEIPVATTLTLTGIISISSCISSHNFKILLFALIAFFASINIFFKSSFYNCYSIQDGNILNKIYSLSNISCQGNIQSYIKDRTYNIKNETQGYDSKIPSKWKKFNSLISEYLHNNYTHDGAVVFAFRHPQLNVNSISLEEIKQYKSISPKIQVDPILLGESKEGYSSWIRSKQLQNSCVVLMLNKNAEEFLPAINPRLMSLALKEEGYIKVDSIETPSEDTLIEIWMRSETTNCNKK